MSKKILITAALPYANGAIHFGHIAGAYLPADCFARFSRLKGNTVLFICGSDEYGIAITLAADLAKRTPEEHVEIFHKINRDIFSKLNISFDHYSRTTIKEHIPIVQEFFLDLKKNGFIEERIEDHLYSEEEKRFLADRYVEGECPFCKFEKARGDECPKCGNSYEAKDLKNPRSKISQKKLILKPSKHWYVRFELFKEKLLSWVKEKNWKPNVMNLSLSYIENLRSRGITRDSSWGVPVPLEEAKDKVFYVWFDAPIGYISATMEWSKIVGQKDKWKDFWFDPETKLVQFLGKDNIPFHSVFFPAMIMGQNKPFKLVDDLPANEFLLLEGRQFSKSDNWTIDLEDFLSRYSVDQIRYYLASISPEMHDAEFTFKDFGQKCNSELLAKLGNFVHRTLVFAEKNTSQEIPELGKMDPKDTAFLEIIEKKALEIAEAYDHYQLRRATQLIMEIATEGNIYFDLKAPWTLAKDPQKKEALNTTIHLSLFAIKVLAIVASPIIPATSEKIFDLLNLDERLNEIYFRDILNPLPTKQKLKTPKPLFRKIEDEEITMETQRLKRGKE